MFLFHLLDVISFVASSLSPNRSQEIILRLKDFNLFALHDLKLREKQINEIKNRKKEKAKIKLNENMYVFMHTFDEFTLKQLVKIKNVKFKYLQSLPQHHSECIFVIFFLSCLLHDC